jgi:CBS domain containing-hemolysin-like protein
MNWVFFLIAVISWIGLFFLSATASALRRLHKRESKKVFKQLGNLFFFRTLLLKLFGKEDYAGTLFSTIVTQNIFRTIAVCALTIWLYELGLGALSWPLFVLALILIILVFFTISDYIPRILGNRHPAKTLAFSSVIASPFLLLSFPVAYLFMALSRKLWDNISFDYLNEPMGDVKNEIFEILQEAVVSPKLSLQDRKLIESVVRFESRIAREIMVPRIDIFSLNVNTSIEQAAKQLQEEGYSRVPVYKDTIDQIVGVLMYKDILTKYMEYQFKGNDAKILQAPVESIVKGVLYTPETKKISNLLQEFRKKQMHIAIVVDEYGGTEGIVTIEDILEEIVGEIEDEYDEEVALFVPLHDGSWVVDARMSILDAEGQFGVHIPQEGDYDTIGGYIFHRAGSIPSRGFIIQLDDVELEVLKSNDRRIEKVKVKKLPLETKNE